MHDEVGTNKQGGCEPADGMGPIVLGRWSARARERWARVWDSSIIGITDDMEPGPSREQLVGPQHLDPSGRSLAGRGLAERNWR